MIETLPPLSLEDYRAIAAILKLGLHLPPIAVLYAIACAAHFFRLHRIVPWIYLGLTFAAIAFR